jgi:hypothetical protein
VRHLHLRRSAHAQTEGTVPPIEPPPEDVLPDSGPGDAAPERRVREEVPPAPTAGER